MACHMTQETDNLQLEELFHEDQKDREKIYENPKALAQLKESDKARRKRLYVMLELGEVKTKRDLYHAAVILHHGVEPSDFLYAHRLSTMAALMGHKTARWLLAASLDRYLMSLGQGQIYGTQFEYNPSDGRYQLKLPMQDSVTFSWEKEFFGIPTVADRLKQLNAQIKAK
jgi:hypothetical protein